MTASLSTIFNAAFLSPGWESLLGLFALNLVSSLVVVRLIYHMAAKRRDFVFTFMLVSTAVFLLCRLLAGVEIDLAFALGLFAIFGIIRYRTNAIPIREMTYLFIVITLAVINALAPLAASWLEIAMANVLIWVLSYILERLWFVEHLATKIVIYDRIELLHAGRRNELIADLEQRTGVSIVHLEIGKVDLLRDTANLKIHFSADQEPGHFEETQD
ncbi:DUF4956 domain-containing protein [Flavobacteriales bacterium]|nr:DUF4956 domain-containing protein [Flavobacteriales bacterium]MEC8336101.1 DUF4956 domain-containing protein [Bacteroidota bacterium]MEC8361884.1 DUF4956 domain-containing protein [Bacteroidota bacterium]MEC8662451.1 DUF4956 domain-containing protein [Bacteroidota bacterium]